MYWLIWSNEHGAWWKANERGYTYILSEAGQYSLEEMKRILEKANQYVPEDSEPHEVGLLIADLAVHYK